jgi:O-antigen/teichoic acid export membrane protein
MDGTMSVGRIARNIGSGYAGVALNGVVLLLLTPLVIRHLGSGDYGIWVLTSAIGSYLGFLNAGSGAAGVRSVAARAGRGRLSEASREVGTIFRIYFCVGLLAAAALVLLSFTALDRFRVPAARQGEARVLLVMIAVNFLVSFPFGVTRSVMAGLQRFPLLNGIEVGTALFRLTAAAVLLGAGFGLVALGAVQLASSLLGHAARAAALRRIAPEIHLMGGPAWSGLAPGVSIFSVLSFGYESLRTLFDNADLLFLGILAGPAAVAVFGVGLTLASIVSKGLQPVSGVLFPIASSMEAQGRRADSARLLEVGTRVNLALGLPLVTLLLIDGRSLLRLWVGEGFQDSVPVLAVLAIANLGSAASLAATTLLFGSGLVKWLIQAEVFRYVINLGLLLVLTRVFGLVGAATATLVSILAVDLWLVTRRACPYVGLAPRSFLLRSVAWPLLSGLPVVLLMAAWRRLLPEPSLPLLALRCAACLAGFALVYALSGTFREERRLAGKVWAEVFR